MTPLINFARRACLVLGLVVMAGSGGVSAVEPSADTTIAGITQPLRWQEAKLQLNQIGVVREVAVKPGDHVKKGQLLVKLDTSVEEAELKQAELEAKSQARVEAAEAAWEVKKSVLVRKQKIKAQDAGAASEVEEAQLDVTEAEAALKIAKLEMEKAKYKVDGERNRIRQMSLISEFDGVVQSVNTSVGEIVSPNAQEPVCTVVYNNPLWVEIRNMPDDQAARIKIGDKLEVRYDERYAGTPIYDQQWVQARVVYKDPVVNSAARTQLVRLEMPNPRNLDSGFWVVVKLPASVAGGGKGEEAAVRP